MKQIRTWDGAITGYLQALMAAGRSQGTIRIRRHYLTIFRTCAPCPGRVSRAALEHVLAQPAWAPETRRSARSTARSFFAWCVDEGIMRESPAGHLLAVRVPPALARPAEDRIIRDALRDADTRLELMIRLAAYCGLRCCEIARVHGRDFDGQMLIVHGKGSKDRQVPVFDPVLRMALLRCHSWLFPGQHGHITPGHVCKLISRGLPSGVTAHMLRHRYATTAWRGTHDLLAVSMLLGHAKPETTKRYIQPDLEPMLAAARAAQA